MREFQKKKSVQKIFSSRYALVFYIIVLVFLGNAVYGAYGKFKQAKSLENNGKRELETLEARKKYLSSHVESIGAESGKQVEVLDRFGMVKPGEHLIILFGEEQNVSKKRSADSGFFGWIQGIFMRN